jgi:hypothetical protein
MAQNTYASLYGTAVSLAATSGPFQQCRRCGSAVGTVGPGISTHPGHLSCAKCGKHISWLGHTHMEALKARKGGRK